MSIEVFCHDTPHGLENGFHAGRKNVESRGGCPHLSLRSCCVMRNTAPLGVLPADCSCISSALSQNSWFPFAADLNGGAPASAATSGASPAAPAASASGWHAATFSEPPPAAAAAQPATALPTAQLEPASGAARVEGSALESKPVEHGPVSPLLPATAHIPAVEEDDYDEE